MNTPDSIEKDSNSARFMFDEQWEKELSGKKVCILTFGCAYNTGDSDLLIYVLKNRGSVIVSAPSEADAIILNTCIVIGSTERKMQKEMNSYPDQEVFVTGCLPLGLPVLLQNQPNVRVIHPDSIHRAAREIKTQFEGPVQVVQIGPGCMGSCRYCITRLARGTIRSIPPPVIISKIESCAESGAVEIRLAGQDLSCYGYDTGEWSLVSLLEQVPTLPDICRIRLGMMNPATLLPIAEHVARAMKKGPFFSFLHLPIQSGSDQVLELMGRGYTTIDIQHILEVFRSEMPEITLAIDIITGFPGETEEDHAKTLDLLSRIKPGMVNVTRYSWRPGTGMERENELPDRIRKDRSRAVIRDAYAMLQKANEMKVGTIIPVVTTELLKPGSVMARSPSYEGVVIREDLLPGIPYIVRISGCTPHYLIGEIVRSDQTVLCLSG